MEKVLSQYEIEIIRNRSCCSKVEHLTTVTIIGGSNWTRVNLKTWSNFGRRLVESRTM